MIVITITFVHILFIYEVLSNKQVGFLHGDKWQLNWIKKMTLTCSAFIILIYQLLIVFGDISKLNKIEHTVFKIYLLKIIFLEITYFRHKAIF